MYNICMQLKISWSMSIFWLIIDSQVIVLRKIIYNQKLKKQIEKTNALFLSH